MRHVRKEMRRAACALTGVVVVIGTLLAFAAPAVATPAAQPPLSTAPQAKQDIVVNGWGDHDGYHVAFGSASNGYAWSQVAVLDPDGIDDSSWTGYQCVSGDGRYAAVVVLPASAANTPSLREHGAFAYSISIATGTVRPIATGVSSTYFDPGCGTGDSAVFTAALGENEQTTQVIRADLATGRVEQQVRVNGQFTSPVPTATGVVGVLGDALVSIPPHVAGTIHPERTVAVPGQAYDLRPAANGGVDFLTTSSGAMSAAWQERGGVLRELGTGPREAVRLYLGQDGLVLESGLADLTPGGTASLRAVRTTGLPAGAVSVSLGGDAAIGYRTGRTVNLSAPLVETTATGAVRTPAAPAAAGAGPATAVPGFVPAGVTSPVVHVPVSTVDAGESAGLVRDNSAQTPACAVPRLDPHVQVLQPNAARVNWASQMAEQNLLTGGQYARPAGFENMGLAAYDANGDFPAIPLLHPAGDSWDTVPRSVFDAIMAQESNWDQASWHALPGISGDPLVADYYGNGGDSITSIDYADADCGYGVSQVTDGMQAGSTMYAPGDQTKIAVDYEENIAAGLEILEKTWNQLYTDGITDNNADPRYLENWYDAAWAYNTGIEPTGSYDQSGCTPGPTCTGPDGTWGLGWANNPGNPDYPPNRAPFLQTTYADAAHPGDWPYQERIMGWMASPLLWGGSPDYATPTYHGENDWLQIPPIGIACTPSGNDCAPPAASGNAGSCGLADYECWWHGSMTWVSDCAATCATSSYTVGAGSREPAVTDPHPPTCSVSSGDLPTTSHGGPIIVDDLPAPVNVVGCSQSPNWSSDGTFTYAYGTDSAGDPIGAIDTHQLGAGFGGHILFTHTETGAQPDLINTGTWRPSLPKAQYYDVKIHLPATGAAATDVVYQINPGDGVSPWKIRVNQDQGAEVWVDLGTYGLAPGATIVLSNKSSMPAGEYDVAFDAVAFLPEGGTIGTPMGGPPTVLNMPAGSNPAWINCPCTYDSQGDPIDTATGYYSDTWSDLSTPGRGMPLDFTRTYMSGIADPKGPNKSAVKNGPFGYGWTFSYDMRATTTASTVTIIQEDGSTVPFTRSGGAYTVAAPRYDATLTQSGGSYTYTRRGTQAFVFDVKTGRLTGETDLAGLAAGYRTKLAYNSSGQLATITDPAGRWYKLSWSGGHIVKLADSSGRVVTYAYDTRGDLTDVFGVGTTRSPKLLSNDRTHYTYTAAHLMSSVRQPDFYNVTKSPAPVLSMSYDRDERVITQVNPDGAKTTFGYGPSAALGLKAGQTLITDPSGHKTLDTYVNGLLVTQVRGYGTSDAATWSYTYDPASLGVTSVTDPDGHTAYATYDTRGNKLTSTDALGNTWSYEYDSHDQLTVSVDPLGLRTTYGYDQAGHVAVGKGHNTGKYTWGDLTSETVTPLGQSAEGTANGGSRVTNYYYDDSAHPADRTRAVDPLGNTTKTAYDKYGDVASVTDPDGNKTLSAYNAEGWLVASVSPAGVAAGVTASCKPPKLGCTIYAYDAWGHVTAQTNPLGHTTRTSYDADGNKVSSTDADGHVTRYAYDPAGQLTTTTQPGGTTLTTSYTPDGGVAVTTDGAGHRTSYAYDAQGRQVSVTDPDGRVTRYAYDLAGNRVSVTDPDGEVIGYTYDADNRQTAITYSDGQTPNVTGIIYDADGRLTTMTDGTGTQTRSYDQFGELSAVTTGGGATIGYQYDADGNVTAIAYPNGSVVTQAYDAAGRLTRITDWNGLSTAFSFRPDGQISKTIFPNGTVASASYDAADDLTGTTLSNGSTVLANVSYQRDSVGLVTSATASGAAVPAASQAYAYTPLAQVASSTGTLTQQYSYDPAGSPVLSSGATQEFDSAGQLCWTAQSASGPLACDAPPSGATAFGYDENGERTAAGSASYAYNGAGELVSASTADGSATYTYDGSGLRASATVAGVTTDFTYSPSGQLLAAGDESYLYGPDGLPVEQIDGAGTSDWYFHDQDGSTAALVDSAGAVAGTYSYDTYGVVAHSGTASTPLEYTGQYTDPVTGFVYLRARYYDPATAQFLTVDPAVAVTGNAYDYALDDPVNGSDPTGLLCLSWSCAMSDAASLADDVQTGADVVGVVALAAGPETWPIAVLAAEISEDSGNVGLLATCAGGGTKSDCEDAINAWFMSGGLATGLPDEWQVAGDAVQDQLPKLLAWSDTAGSGPLNAGSPQIGPGSVPAQLCAPPAI